MLITVTEEDIAQGCRSEVSNCPVARAVARAAGYPYVWVCTLFIAVFATSEDMFAAGAFLDPADYEGKALKYWNIPRDVANRINLYDLTGHMNPFSFEL